MCVLMLILIYQCKGDTIESDSLNFRKLISDQNNPILSYRSTVSDKLAAEEGMLALIQYTKCKP